MDGISLWDEDFDSGMERESEPIGGLPVCNEQRSYFDVKLMLNMSVITNSPLPTEASSSAHLSFVNGSSSVVISMSPHPNQTTAD